MVAIRLDDLRPEPEPFTDADRDVVTRALQAAAARLGVILDAPGEPPLPTWTVMRMLPSKMAELLALYDRPVFPGQVVLDLTWPAGTAVADFSEPWILHHGAGHWLAHWRLGVACNDPAMWRESERLARRAEGPGWLAQWFGQPDPGAAYL